MKIRRIFALIFMGITVFLSFLTYSKDIQKKFLFVPWTEHIEFTMKPSFTTTLLAVLLYASVVIRRHKLIFRDWYDTTISVLNILFCASFISFFFSGEPWPIPFINISSRTFLIIAIIFSWLCMSSLTGFIWILLFGLAIPRMTTGDIAMGNFGIMYVLGGFLGICFQSENIGNTFTLLKDEFLGLTSRVGSDVNASISSAQSSIRKLR